ncbi:glycosyltransferase [Chitinophaga lutea]|uniref:Glycosyltransferase n=1 Tax=Chitinophaga lutea TaxID=2488634 RepID=A0A3N4PP57_9BACT|nr:glycosyltransferase [Chitinophaga lutea]RPE08449.1 glycosyltransferase [Chitinophaga lutea]
MNILFIVPSYKPAYVYGGPVVCIAKLAERLVQLGHSVTVYTTTANGKSELDVPLEKPVMMNGVKILYFKRITGDHTHVSPRLWKATWRTVRQYDAVHMHSWWNLLIMGASLMCTLRGVKPVLSPHGMLCDYVFDSRNQLKKKILHNTVGKFLLSKTHLHVSSHMEWDECLRVNSGWNGAMIYNLVDLPGEGYPKSQNQEFTISFLSRIDPKKGLDILLAALAKVDFPFRLQVAGSGEESYVEQMKQKAGALGLTEKVDWVGWKNNEEKFSFLAGSDLFALTSHNENFAIVVIESLAVGTPVLVSEHVGLSRYVNDNRLGWVTGIGSIDEVKNKLNAAHADWEERNRIHQSAAAIIRNDFNETTLANGYLGMYQHLQASRAQSN